MIDQEIQEFVDVALITFQLWAKGEIKECPLSLPYIQINAMCGRIDRLTKALKEFNDGKI